MTQMLGSSIMKKTMKFIGLIAMAALLFSCEKKNIDTPVENPQETETPSDLSQLDPGKYLVSFGATIEDPYTKATMTIDTENGTIAFEDGDEVLVVSGEKTGTYVYGSSVFSPKPGTDAVPTGSGDICAYYPATAYTASSGNVTFKLPGGADNTTTLGDKNPMAATLVISEGTASATFTNFCSILQVSITGNRTLKKVSLNNASKAIAQDSEYSVTWSKGVPSIATEATDKKAIEISSSATLDPTTPTVFYFILPAGTNLSGVSVTAYTTEEDNGGMSNYTISRGDWTPKKNQIYQMSFYAGLFSGGTGTSEDPYIIANARDFKHIDIYCTSGYGSLAASDFLGAYYQQTADIDFKNVQMAPIGDSDNQFTGTYDGNNKELQNVNISETGAFAGIFAYVNGSASIKDLTVSGKITKTETTNNSCVGGIAGIVRGAASVSGCTNNATITSSATYTGGIVGRLYQSTSSTAISGCTNNGTVTSTAPIVGGIVGQQINGGNITECVNTGTVSGTSYVGGIAGDMGIAGNAPSALSFISFCRNNATINASANCSGGIAGRIINGSVVSSCFAKGTVSSESYDVGGIAGVIQVNNSNALSRVCVYDCLTAMNVTTTRSGSSNDTRTGGAVGTVLNNQAQFIAIDNCGVIATSVTVGGGAKVGGFAGDLYSSNTGTNRTRIRNSYTLVSTISSPDSQYGGFVGATHSIDGKNTAGYGELHYCYYVADDTHVSISSKITQDNLTKKTAEEIASAATCEAFNANTYVLTISGNNYGSSLGWAIPSGCDYPVPGSLIAKGEEYYK